MKAKLLFVVVLICQFGFSQENNNQPATINKPKTTYYKFDFGIPLISNPNYGNENPITGEEEPWLTPDGIILRTGMGKDFSKWLGIGINIGFDWKESECMVKTPIFGSVRVSPLAGKECRLNLEAGYGRCLTLSGANLAGYFRKVSLGFDLSYEKDMIGIYFELCDYGFSKYYPDHVGNVSVGLSYTLH